MKKELGDDQVKAYVRENENEIWERAQQTATEMPEEFPRWIIGWVHGFGDTDEINWDHVPTKAKADLQIKREAAAKRKRVSWTYDEKVSHASRCRPPPCSSP